MAHTPKCHFCPVCDGRGCIGELPGMGGVFENYNFIANCFEWKILADRFSRENRFDGQALPAIRLAPITGGTQNVGYAEEQAFYEDLITGCMGAGLSLSIGDGYPDEKLQFGIQALRSRNAKAAVFMKPYANERLYERLAWAHDVAEIVGVDIDAYAIITMRNLAQLEYKTVNDLRELRSRTSVPFAVKGVFTASDIDLVRDLKPDIIVVSNHGGRVETGRGSSASFLETFGPELKGYCSELWVDGGIRSRSDLASAGILGASVALIARPVISSLLREGPAGIKKWKQAFYG